MYLPSSSLLLSALFATRVAAKLPLTDVTLDVPDYNYTETPLGECEGYCTANWHCGEGLACWWREDADDDGPRGCSGKPTGRRNYCYDEFRLGDFGSDPWFLPDRQLRVCQGDCDFDEDCEGDLECFQRGWDEPGPPECRGTPVGQRDYCYDPLWVPPSPSPSAAPTAAATDEPTAAVTDAPTAAATTASPTGSPTAAATDAPTAAATTASPTGSPTAAATDAATEPEGCVPDCTSCGFYSGKPDKKYKPPAGRTWNWWECAELCLLRPTCMTWTLQLENHAKDMCHLRDYVGPYLEGDDHTSGFRNDACTCEAFEPSADEWKFVAVDGLLRGEDKERSCKWLADDPIRQKNHCHLETTGPDGEPALVSDVCRCACRVYDDEGVVYDIYK